MTKEAKDQSRTVCVYNKPMVVTMTPQEVKAKKDIARQKGLENRRLMTSEDKARASKIIANSLLSRAEILEAKTVCIYISTPDEVDTKSIITELFRLDKAVVAPKVTGSILTLHMLTAPDDVAPGAFGIEEPSSSSTFVSASSVDVFVVPGVVFDRKKFRIGWGKGYYDKLLADVTVPRIGLAYDTQLIAEIPTSSYDVSMTALITEKESI
jgi:5-formyltetrahydrofolate cyclo-ligase